MADISDASTLLVNMATAALYPNGTGQASAIGADCKIFPGWPNSTALDADLRAGLVNVSVFPVQGSTANAPLTLDNPQMIVGPVHGLTATVNNQSVTLTGTPSTGEFLTIVADKKHAYSASGASAAAILATLLTAAQVDYPSASLSGSTLTIPSAYLVARLGAPATLANVTHRQKQAFWLTVWAPSEALRSAAASTIDVALKMVNTVTFPDTSKGILTFDRTIITDLMERAICYRRDLVFNLEYATLDTYQAVEVTTVGVSGVNVPTSYFPVSATT